MLREILCPKFHKKIAEEQHFFHLPSVCFESNVIINDIAKPSLVCFLCERELALNGSFVHSTASIQVVFQFFFMLTVVELSDCLRKVAVSDFKVFFMEFRSIWFSLWTFFMADYGEIT